MRKRCRYCGRRTSRRGRCVSVRGIPRASQIVCVRPKQPRKHEQIPADYTFTGDGLTL